MGPGICFVPCRGVVFRGRVSARRPTYLLLLRQKKVGQEKATRMSATPSLRCGATCVVAVAGFAAELAAFTA
ncbi:hypothetical protein F3K36_24060 [Delftia sp. BR1]|nr:hypothetical protein F3K36_24060 [Delftia sp. BR1]